MPKQVDLLRVFVASPGDVEDERKALESIIRDLNVNLVKTHNVFLELIKWETHAYPNLGDNGQSVINEQISDDYDIFIGILWKRFGTPTPRAMSGTAEEFDRAYNRFQENPKNLRVLIYFRESPVPPNQLDPEQLTLLKNFRDRLGDRGGLYKTYTEVEDFTRMVSMHILLHINDYGKKWGGGVEVQQKKIEDLPESEFQISDIDFEDIGFLDLIEMGTESFNASGETAEALTALMEEFSEIITSRTEEYNSLPTPVNTKQAKKIINRYADDLEHFAARMQLETPRLIESYSIGVNSFGKAAELLPDFGLVDESQIENAVGAVHNMKEVLYGTQGSITEFRDIVRNSPRITTKFNQAKRKALSVVDNFIDEITRAINITIEVEDTMKRIIGD